VISKRQKAILYPAKTYLVFWSFKNQGNRALGLDQICLGIWKVFFDVNKMKSSYGAF